MKKLAVLFFNCMLAIAVTAQIDAGAISAQPDTNFQIDNSCLSCNSAKYGGGLHVNRAASAWVQNVVFMNNTADTHTSRNDANGAAIWISRAELTVQECKFMYNMVYDGGGNKLILFPI